MWLQRLIGVVILILVSCAAKQEPTSLLGKFEVNKDLYLPQFDCKTDVDDVHSVAAVATILADPRFADIRYHAVAGAYGTQKGLYVPANEVFEAAFGENWSDAHGNYQQALDEVSALVARTLEGGGDIWIADAGQSDFSADMVRNMRTRLPDINTKERIHVVQHSNWNEEVTAPENLAYVKANADYHKIPDGNAVGNGTPGFRDDIMADWQGAISTPDLRKVWEMAIAVGNKYNGQEGRYNNTAIANGGLDFSDVSETCWIFGFDHLKDADAFFQEFAQ